MMMMVVVVAVMMLTIVLLLIPMMVWGHSWSRRGRFLELSCPVWGGRSWSRWGRFLELTCPLGGGLEGSRRGAGEGPEGRVPGAVAARSEGVPGTLPNRFGMDKTIRKLIY